MKYIYYAICLTFYYDVFQQLTMYKYTYLLGQSYRRQNPHSLNTTQPLQSFNKAQPQQHISTKEYSLNKTTSINPNHNMSIYQQPWIKINVATKPYFFAQTITNINRPVQMMSTCKFKHNDSVSQRLKSLQDLKQRQKATLVNMNKQKTSSNGFYKAKNKNKFYQGGKKQVSLRIGDMSDFSFKKQPKQEHDTSLIGNSPVFIPKQSETVCLQMGQPLSCIKNTQPQFSNLKQLRVQKSSMHQKQLFGRSQELIAQGERLIHQNRIKKHQHKFKENMIFKQQPVNTVMIEKIQGQSANDLAKEKADMIKKRAEKDKTLSKLSTLQERIKSSLKIIRD